MCDSAGVFLLAALRSLKPPLEVRCSTSLRAFLVLQAECYVKSHLEKRRCTTDRTDDGWALAGHSSCTRTPAGVFSKKRKPCHGNGNPISKLISGIKWNAEQNSRRYASSLEIASYTDDRRYSHCIIAQLFCMPSVMLHVCLCCFLFIVPLVKVVGAVCAAVRTWPWCCGCGGALWPSLLSNRHTSTEHRCSTSAAPGTIRVLL